MWYIEKKNFTLVPQQRERERQNRQVKTCNPESIIKSDPG